MLLTQPSICLDPAGSREDVTIGRALFSAPGLLGGQAQRASVSCASCHTNGRRNPAFFLAGISDMPGTADVSSSFFSLARANTAFDPRPIPDLAMPGKISRDPGSDALKRFVRGLIVEEFSGNEPSQRQLAGLAAYVRAVRACPGGATEPVTLARDIDLVSVSIQAAQLLLGNHDEEGARIAIGGARFRLGLIDERMIGQRGAALRRQLLQASKELAAAPLRSEALGVWLRLFERSIVPRLRRAERGSLYDPAAVDTWLARQQRAR